MPTDLIAVLGLFVLAAFAIYRRSGDRRATVGAKKAAKTTTKTVYLIPPEFLRHYPGAKEIQVNGEAIWVLDIANQTVGFAANGQIGYRYTKLGREEWEVWPDMDGFRDWLRNAPVKQVQQPKQNQPQPAGNGQLNQGQVKQMLKEQECIDFSTSGNPSDLFTADEKNNKYALPQGWHWEGSGDAWLPRRNKNQRP